ncbi:DUF6174 domain-containing protein [Deinococcus arcticus]|uniref:Uncharacterized protein n=1 Tax=Deinococcus arcticus TaxID=2136176 RepID=A0A2T3W8A9_9DEIO|nr:DUF6174 domain-containing protein [Deinococcus arcticus]PTA68138.1 hypothetical protein C8263_08665 [Deinococcus arcticus]
MSAPLRAALLTLTVCASLAAPLAQAGGAGAPQPAVPGCRPGYVRPDFAALNRQLAQARARWAAQGLTRYRYEIRQVAAPVLLPATQVTVKDGAVLAAPVQPGPVNTLARLTVEGRFASLAQTLQYQATTPCPEVQVRYDAALGFPVYLYSGRGDNGIADGYGEWTVSAFTPLP